MIGELYVPRDALPAFMSDVAGDVRRHGDQVIYGKYGGSEVEVDGEELKILRESDILAKVVS